MKIHHHTLDIRTPNTKHGSSSIPKHKSCKMLSLSIFSSPNSLLVWRNVTIFDSNKGMMNASNIFGFLFLFTQAFKVKVLWSVLGTWMTVPSFWMSWQTQRCSPFTCKKNFFVKLIHRLPLKTEWKSIYIQTKKWTEGIKERTSKHLNRQTIYYHFHLSHFLWIVGL